MSEIMDWIERSNCDVYAVNETGLRGEEYMEVSDGYTWYAANREWTKGKSGGAWIIIEKGIRCEEVMSNMKDVCFVKGRVITSLKCLYELRRNTKRRNHLEVGIHNRYNSFVGPMSAQRCTL